MLIVCCRCFWFLVCLFVCLFVCVIISYDTQEYPSIFESKDFEIDMQRIDNKNIDNNNSNNENSNNSNSNSNDRVEMWSDELRDKLMSGLNKYHDNWDKVSQFVGKPKKECIIQFLQLPIEDSYLSKVENDSESNSNNKNNNSSNSNSNSNSLLSPFSDISHPHLGEAASLASLVSNDVIKVASNAALKYLTEKNNSRPKSKSKTKSKTKGKSRKLNLNYLDEEDTRHVNDNWERFPKNVIETKAKAAGILGASSVISRALYQRSNQHIEQMVQHLVLLQSQKVKLSSVVFE